MIPQVRADYIGYSGSKQLHKCKTSDHKSKTARDLSNGVQGNEISKVKDFRNYSAHLHILQMHTLRDKTSSQSIGEK